MEKLSCIVYKQALLSTGVIIAEVWERLHLKARFDCRWAVEQLSGGPMLTKGSPATRLATLHFLARQAFFADKAAAPQVSTHTYETLNSSHCSSQTRRNAQQELSKRCSATCWSPLRHVGCTC